MHGYMPAAFLADVAFFHPFADKGLVACVRAVHSTEKALTVTAATSMSVFVVPDGFIGDNFGDIFKTMPFAALGASVAFVPLNYRRKKY